MRPQRCLLIAPPYSYRIVAYAAAAERLGVELLVASDGEHSLTPQVSGGLWIPLNAPERALELIQEEALQRPIGAVLATDDTTVELASRAAAALGLAHNSLDAARISRRKDLARATLARAGIPVPGFRRLDLEGDLRRQASDLRFPCVLKPLAMSASRGVMRVDDAAALVAGCGRIARIVAGQRSPEERRFALAEDFIPGCEIALEGLLDDGVLEVIAIFDKPDPLDGPYFEETFYVTPSRLSEQTQERIRRRVAQACAAYGLHTGPVHAEVRVNARDAWVVELAARTIGGDCARLLRFGAGEGLESLVLRQALGLPIESRTLPGAAGVLMLPTPAAGILRRVEGVSAARAVPGVEDLVLAVREGYELQPLPEGGSYLGFVFARGDTPQQVETALRSAYAKLRVIVAPAWRLHPARTAAAAG